MSRGLLSDNPEEREEALRHLLRRALAEASCPTVSASKHLGRSRQLFEKQIADDGDCYIRLSDLCKLEEKLPGLVAELVAPLNLHVRPVDRSGTVPAILDALGSTMSRTGELAHAVTEAVRDGDVDGPEALKIERASSGIVRAVGEVQAAVAVAASRSRR